MTSVLFYAKHPEPLAAFYVALLGLERRHATPELIVLAGMEAEIIVHALPAPVASEVEVAVPPALRDTCAIKPIFRVPDLEAAIARAEALGGGAFGPRYPGRGFTATNAFDCEGNIVQLRGPA